MNRNTIIAGALVLAAIAGGVVYLTDDSPQPTGQSAANGNTPGAAPATGAATESVTSPTNTTAAPGREQTQPPPPDPRLAALQVSPDNGLIKFIVGDNGKVIAEIDQDPASPGFGKPSREYMYRGNQVVGLAEYRYMSDHVEITQTTVAYKPDGSVDEIRAATRYEGAKKSR